VVGGGVNGRNVKVMNGATGEVLWYYNFVDRVYDVTGAPDLDGDGHPDVLVSLQDQNSQPYQFYAFKGLPMGIEENSNNIVKKDYVSVTRYHDGVLVKLSIPQGRSFSYQLYNVNGRILETTPMRKSSGGVSSINISKVSKPSGIYIVRVNIEGERTETIKLSLF